MFHPSKQLVYNWYISMVAASCMILYGYDAAVFNAVYGSKAWKAYYGNPDANMQGTINTAYTCGAIFSGFFISAPISDRFGRRWTMACGCLIVIVSTFIQAFSPSGTVAGFLVGRCLVGVGQGLALPAGPVYIGELAPPEIRGTIMSFWQTFYSVGAFIAYWINYACTKNVTKLAHNWDWRMVVIFQLMCPVGIIIALWWCPESPRWFVGKGRLEDARASLRRVRATEEEVEEEMVQIRQAIEFEKETIGSGRYLPLWKDKSVRYRLGLAFVINCGQQLTGQGSLVSYSTKIYQPIFNNNDTIQLINALNATFGILFTLNATWTVDRFGRKIVLWVGALGMMLCMIMAGCIVTQTPTVGGKHTHPVGIATVFVLFLFIFFYKPSWGATVWIWTSEIFSMNVRAQAVGMSSQMQNVANLVLNQVFPVIFEKIGFKVMFMFAGINFLLMIFVIFYIPETKGVKLENMDTIFGGVNHSEKGADLVHDEDGQVIHGKSIADGGVGLSIEELEHVAPHRPEELRATGNH